MIQQPFVSIIIPVLNAQAYIGICLEALLILDYPKDKFEIIVIDNGSSDETLSIVQKYPVKFLLKTNCNISALRNWGTQQARGNIFAFIDADCVAPKNWLNEAVNILNSNTDNAAVGCWYALPKSTTKVERVWDIVTSARRDKTGPIDWVPSGDLIVKKEIYQRIHGFDEYLITSEDVDICQRITQVGGIVYSSSKVAVEHLGNPKTLKIFFLKEKWRGEGVIQNAFRNFPHIEWNNAIIFGLITLFILLLATLGLILLPITGSHKLLLNSFFALLYLPLLLTLKTLINKPHWSDFLHLWGMFTVYGVARAASVLNPKIWSKKGKN